MPELWPENRAAWDCWCLLNELKPGEAMRLVEIESYARLMLLDARRLAAKVARIERARRDNPNG